MHLFLCVDICMDKYCVGENLVRRDQCALPQEPGAAGVLEDGSRFGSQPNSRWEFERAPDPFRSG